MKGKRILVVLLSIMMLFTTSSPTMIMATSPGNTNDAAGNGGPELYKIEVKDADKDLPYTVIQLAEPDTSEEAEYPYIWSSGITKDEKKLDKLGTTEDFLEPLEDISKEKNADELLTLYLHEKEKYFDFDSALMPSEKDENTFEVAPGYYYISGDGYIPNLVEITDKDVKVSMIKDVSGNDKEDKNTQNTAKGSSKKSATRSADNEWIERFTTSFARGAENVNGQLVWTPTNANADHRFVYRVNYAFSGEFELPPNSVEIRVPKSILKDRNGNYDDYYDIAVPLEADADENTKFVYKEEGDELVIWNIQEVSAGESGTIECSYLTKDKTFYYVDMAAHDQFYADIAVTNNNQTVTAHDTAAPVHINTNSVIVDTDKRRPVLYRSWDSSWGPRPADADDYLYIRWEVRTHVLKENTQPYDFTLTDTFDDGDVVGYKFEGQSQYTTNNTIRNIYQESDERYDYVITRHSKADFTGRDYTVWNNIRATVHPVDLLDPDTHATDREPFSYEMPTYHYPPGHFYADKFGQYTDVYTTNFHPESYGIVQDSEDISDYSLDEFVSNETDKMNDPHLKYYTYVRGYPYPWTLPDGATGDDPSQYGQKPVKYELWDETIDIEDGEPLIGGTDYEFSQLHFIFDFSTATFNQDTLEFDAHTASASDFTSANNVIFYAKKAGDTDYVRVGEYSPRTKTWSNLNGSYVTSANDTDVYFKPGVIGYKLETSNAFWYTCLRAYPHLTLFRTPNVLSQIGESLKVRIDNTAFIKITDWKGNELFPGDATNSRGGLFKDGMVNSDYVMGVLKQSNIEKYVTGTRNNKTKKTYTVTWRIDMEESYTDNDGRHQIEQSSGTFYDLCPSGSHPDKNSVIVYDDGTEIDPSYYDVSVKPNYKDSGRDLIIIDIKKPGTKYSFYYDTVHEWEDLSQVHFDIFNSVAYETGNKKIAEGYPDNGGTGQDKDILNDLDPDTDAVKFIYSQDWHDVDLVVATSTGINKKVKDEDDQKYSYSTMTRTDGNYSYRLRIANDDVTRLKNIVLYDSLENFTKPSENIASDWHGTLHSVDTTALREAGIFPVVYYSSLENMDIYSHHDLDEVDDHGERVWKTKAEFGDISNAKAIAIDCRKTLDGEDFVLMQDQSLIAYVYMKAPSRDMELGRIPYAYNNIFLDSIKIDPLDQEHPDLIHQDYTKIGYVVKGDIDFYKADKKNHDTRIEGISFRLYGRSDYDNDVDMTATSTANGRVSFKGVEKGTYKIRELGGSDDWQIDRELKSVTIDAEGNAVLEGFNRDGIFDPIYIWENEERAHADISFTKRSHQRNANAQKAIDDIKAITPGSADTVTIDGQEFFVLVNENNERALLLAKEDITSGHSCFPNGFEYENEYWRTRLQTYLDNKPTLDDLVLTTTVNYRYHPTNEEKTVTDKVFVLTEADYNNTVKGGTETPEQIDFTYNHAIVTNAIKNAVTSDIGNYWFRDSIFDDPNISWGSNRNYEASTYKIDTQSLRIVQGNNNSTPYYQPAMWVSIASVPNVAIPNTTFAISGTSDYGNEIYETGITGINGKLTINNIEQGTYTLVETQENPDYLPNETVYTVKVDKNGLVSIFNGNEPVEQKNSEYTIRNTPRYHDFEIRKVDEASGEWLAGAEFRLYGVSNIGTQVDMTITADSNGKAEFIDIEAGTYLIQETKAPDRHLLDKKSHIVTVDDFGTVSIEGMSPNEYGEIEWPNERALEGKIIITKVWKDNKTDNERPVPTVTISTKKPLYMTEAYAVFDSSDGSLTFFRDEKNKYTNGQTSGTKTYYTGIETIQPRRYYSDDVPWNSKRSSITSIITKDVIKPVSTANWFEKCTNLTSCDLSKLDTSNTTSMYCMFGSGGSDARIHLTDIDVSHFDTSKVTDMDGMFWGCDNLTNLDLTHFDTSSVTDTSCMFYDCKNLTSIDISGWDTSNVTDMDHMFAGCENLTDLDVSDLDTENVTKMDSMFNGCKGLTSLDLSNFDTANATNMGYMFYNCHNLTDLDISSFDTGNVKDMQGMFYNCRSLTTLDVSDFDTKNVTSMYSMFQDCKLLTGIDASEWDTSKVTDMSYMFKDCGKLTSIDMSDWNTSNVTTMVEMFYNCSSLTTLDVSDFDTQNVKRMDSMFYGCDSLTSLDVSNFDTQNVTNMNAMFRFCSSLTSLDVTNFETGNVTNMGGMFGSCHGLTSIDVSNFDTDNVTNMSSMFAACDGLTSLDLQNFDTGNVTTMSNMFAGCNKLTTLDLSNFETDNVTTMYLMFQGCNNLESLNLSSFDTSNVTDMSYMFSGCKSLRSLDLSNFNTGNVTTMNSMFSGCEDLTALSLASFDTSKVTGMSSMFSACYDLTSLDVSSFNTGNVTNMAYMFSSCSSLASLDLSNFNTESVTNMEAMFNNCDVLTNPDVSSFNTSNVENMSFMFSHCYALPSVDISSFNTSKVKDMNRMFNSCYVIATIYVSDLWDTNNVTSSSAMFSSCSNLPNFNSSITDKTNAHYNTGGYLIYKAAPTANAGNSSANNISTASTRFTNRSSSSNLFVKLGLVQEVYAAEGDIASGTYDNVSWRITANNELIIGEAGQTQEFTDRPGDAGRTYNSYPWLAYKSQVTSIRFEGTVKGKGNMSYLFYNFPAVTSIDTSGFDTSGITHMDYMFSSCGNLTNLDLSGFNTSNVVNMSGMFYYCDDLTSLNISGAGWNTSNVTHMGEMFSGCYKLTNLDLSGFDTSNVTRMNAMFYSCKALTNLDVSSFNTSKVTDMHMMFYGCSNLTSLDVSGFDTSKVTNMSDMFWFCTKITDLDVSGFDTSNVTKMDEMFYRCYRLKNLDVSGFDTSNVTDMSEMFRDCSDLTSLDVSGFDTSNVTNMNMMFYNCSSLTTLDLSSFDTSNVTNMDEMLNYCSTLQKLVLGEGFTIPSSNNNLSLPGKWQRIATESGRKVKAGPLLTSAELVESYNGATDHGIYLKEGTDPSNYGIDLSETYTTLDENWVKNGDGTWTYTFDVYDDEVPFYGFEDLLAGYDIEYDEDSQFIINEDGVITKSMTITNTSTETAKLDISKTVTDGYSGDNDKKFKFKVEFSHEDTSLFEGRKTYGDKLITDGVYEFTLKHGQSLQLEGLPIGTNYVVTEESAEGFETTITNANGTLNSAATVSVQANNRRIRPNTQDLVVKKEIEGDITNGEIFELEAVFSGLTPNVSYSTSKESFTADSLGNAKYEFTLSGGQEVTFYNLPEDAKYTIKEKGGNYTPSYTVENTGTGTIVKPSAVGGKNEDLSTSKETIDEGETATVTFTNTREKRDDGTYDLKILKKDSADQEPLKDATFRLYGTSDNGEEIDISLISNSEGKINFKNIEYGTYTLKETKAPAGYQLDSTEREVKITDGKIKTAVSHTPNINDEGAKTVDFVSDRYYTDIVSIPGADKLTLDIDYTNVRGEFYIWSGEHPEAATQSYSNNFSPDTAVSNISYAGTNNENIILHKQVTVPGDTATILFKCYAYPQNACPPNNGGYNENTNYGYFARVTAGSEEPITVQGLTANSSGEFVAYNTKKDTPTTEFQLKKVDATNDTVLSGARFELKQGSEVIDRKVSGNNGLVTFDGLESGSYTLKEIESPKGYILSDEEYNVTVTSGTVRKVSHTPNISDDNVQSGTYPNGLQQRDIVTIPGASSMHLKVTYGTENSWDMLYIFQGEYNGAISRNMSAGQLYKLMGGNDTPRTVEYDVPGDTVTFAFYSDSSVAYYGYFAEITAGGGDQTVTVTDSSGTALPKDGEAFKITNTKDPKNFTLKKKVTGDGDRTKQFTFNYILTDATPNASYTVVKGETEETITTDATGSYSGTCSLADNEEITIHNLPSEAKIVVTEIANDHKASYRGTAGKDSLFGENDDAEIALTTSQISMSDSAKVTFENNKGGTIPLPTGVRLFHDIIAIILVIGAIMTMLLIRKRAKKE